MKVKQLIRKLKRMPQDLNVGYAHHDNSDGEVAGWVDSVGEADEVDMGTGQHTGRIIVLLRS
jgi:hypothetical protein